MPRGPKRSQDRQVEEGGKVMSENMKRLNLLARIKTELRGYYGAWGLSPYEAADILENEAMNLRSDAEKAKKLARGR
jgi:hypothetical protein